MILTFIWFIAGLAALVGGAELLVRGSSRLASSFGISKIVIGLTIVAFGTSAPELAVTISSGLEGEADILLGNIIGSNISNTLLILGISAILLPLHVDPRLIRLDVPVMIAVSVLVFILAIKGGITFWDCVLLTAGLVIYLLYQAKNSRSAAEADVPDDKGTPLVLNIIYIPTGLVLLVAGARWVVDSAILMAEAAGVSELVIGLTVVSLGTSLPELTTSIVAAIRKERELVISNVIGSNLFNLLGVLGVTGIVIPQVIPVNDALLRFDLPVMLAASFACIPIFFTGHRISRWEGWLFLLYYAAYVFYLWLASAEHAALAAFSNTMLWFVLPITGITLLMVAVRERNKRARVWKYIKRGEEQQEE